MTTSVAKEVGNAISAGDSRVHSDRGSRENECSDVTPSTEGGGYSKKPLYNRGR